ncbi:MAG: hypothetical protein ACE5F9_15800 [Phycisphaerae bacterium]
MSTLLITSCRIAWCLVLCGLAGTEPDTDKPVGARPAHPAAAGERGGYAVCVSKETYADAGWKVAANALVSKHHATLIVYPSGKPSAAVGRLARLAPRYVCFVARPTEVGRRFVMDVHRLTRRLDDDPYVDCIWGIVTGYDAEDAVRIAKTEAPLGVRRLLAGTGTPEPFVEGVAFSEGEAGVRREKAPGGTVVVKKGPPDTTADIVAGLNAGDVDVVITSGHASERDWQIGFSFHGGQLRCRAGRLFGLDTKGAAHPITTSNPKVYLASGNCLAGHIPDREAMALAWMHSAGVRQLVGYTVSTWFGYVGWGTKDYWVGSQSRLSLAEAFHAAVQADLFELQQFNAGSAKLNPDSAILHNDMGLLERFGKKHGISDRRNLGLLWDRDAVAFYGDPAWDARLVPATDPAYRVEVTESPRSDGRLRITVAVTATRDGAIDKPVFALLDRRVHDATLPEGVAAAVADHCVLWKISGPLRRGEVPQLVFTAAAE